MKYKEKIVIALEKVIEGTEELIELNKDSYISSAKEVDNIVKNCKKIKNKLNK